MGLVDPLPELVLIDVPFILAELLLDGLHLFAKIILPLRFVDPFLNFGLDLRPELELLHKLREDQHDELQPLSDIQALQDLLLFRHAHRQHRGDDVRDGVRLVDIQNDGELFIGQVR